jgi:signal transduction histidine kinase
MSRRFRPPLFAVAAAMFGLIVLLATLQYRWLGQISAAERDRMRATLNTRATGFAHDFDRELTRAYLLFQADGPGEAANAGARLSARYDRWIATARFPRMIGAIYVMSLPADGKPATQRFDPASRLVEPADLPEPLRHLQDQMAHLHAPTGAPDVRPAPSVVLDAVPALVVHTPTILLTHDAPGGMALAARLSFTILLLDRQYVVNEMLPALAAQHFRGTGDGFDYQLAVVRPEGKELLYQSTGGGAPPPDGPSDAAVDLFAVRLQEFSALAAEVRRFVTFSTAVQHGDAAPGGRGSVLRRETIAVAPTFPGDRLVARDPQLSVWVQRGLTPAQKGALTAGFFAASPARTIGTPKWKLLVTHPAGSLEAAVQAARRRNGAVSTGILALLGASMGLLVVSTRRAQRLAAQQMEFVAAVSHELRTPLAVIRSAGENLADGVVRDDEQIRKYGDLVRHEGRRLTEMVEQILEFAGIQSGQRGFALRPVAVRQLLEEVVEASRALADQAGIVPSIDVPESLPPLLGDEAALRRVFQNLVSNAIKYGAGGEWIGLRAEAAGREVRIIVSDRGMGIPAVEHSRIFEPFYRAPDAITAQIHGAGLGLALVKRIVEAHGGRIEVRSEPGRGSDFVVTLPAAGEEPIPAAGNGEPRPAAHPAGLRS